jgi:hypothetical protein
MLVHYDYNIKTNKGLQVSIGGYESMREEEKK